MNVQIHSSISRESIGQQRISYTDWIKMSFSGEEICMDNIIGIAMALIKMFQNISHKDTGKVLNMK